MRSILVLFFLMISIPAFAAYDTIDYAKQDDGSFRKTITHTEVTTDLDNDIKVTSNNITQLSADINNSQQILDGKRKQLAEYEANLTDIQAKNVGKASTTKTYTEESDGVNVTNEIAVIQATITNLQAGKPTSDQDKTDIDAAIKNYQDALVELRS